MSLKKFEIQEMVAKGGMAEVYRAKTVGLQGFEKEVCVKKILPHLTEDESFVNMFINEAKLAATLSYANIVSVHDLCVSANGEYFIVMEYVHGKDLSDVIRAAQLAGREVPPDVAVYISREVCKGLHYAHSKVDVSGASLNIIHRDISPHNVLVSFMGEVKITDFGIAKASSIMNKTAVGILKGKYGYMSPEQARGQPLDHRSDIFNTGIVLYELLVGERCFAGSSDFSTLNLMRNAVVTPPTKINSSLPKDLEAIVLRALAGDRNDRYRDALELESALASFAESHGKRMQAHDLASFMKELFTGTGDEKRSGGSTGVLSLSSVVGPAAEPDKPAAHAKQKAPPRRGTERASELADQPISHPIVPPDGDEPGREALERAKRRAEKKGDPPPAVDEPRAKSEAVKLDAKEELRKAALEKKEELKKAALEKKEELKKAALEKKAKAAEPEPKAAEPPAEAKAEDAKAERKPARLKPGPDKPADPAEDKKKGGGKQLSDSPKKPVGRRDLRPGLTALNQISRPGERRSLLRAALIVLVALGAGAVVGLMRAEQTSRQKTFRDMELSTRDPALVNKETVTVLITTEPAGATVKLDKNELSERTPLAVERDRDQAEHELEIMLDGFKSTKRKLTFEPGPVTRFFERLAGEPGTLKVASKPSELSVKVDGKEVGKTPVSIEIASGRRDVEIGGGAHEVVKATVDVKAGKTTSLTKKVAPKGAIGSLRITSDPQAQILLDDEPTGRWTNDGEIQLEPDVSHRLGLLVRDPKRADRRERRELVVKLKKGEKRELFLDLTGSS